MATESLKKIYENKKDYYSSVRSEMLQFVPENCQRVLEVGCGEGGFISTVKKMTAAEAWGVDISEESISIASEHIDKAICTDLTEDMSILPNNYFDAIFFNDVLEHIIDPESLLKDISSKLSSNGVVIASIPNFRHHKVLVMLLRDKDFKYEGAGVMDNSHLRFFTRKSMIRLFKTANYNIQSIVPINKSKSLRPVLIKLFTLGIIGNDISFLQYVIVARTHK